jgi:hypothetical protein
VNSKALLVFPKKSTNRLFALILLTLCWLPFATAQQSPSAALPTSAASTVPALVNFSGTLSKVDGKPLTSVTGVTFLLYQDPEGGAPLWMETQNVYPDKNGHYSVVLGSANSQGLPQDLFASGEARWLAVQIVGKEEQPRVLLVAVPYALKASDAETVGGFPPSAFVRANQSAGDKSSSPSSTPNAPSNPTITGKGTISYIPMWDKTNDIINSVLFQEASSIGVGTATPASKLDVSGNASIRDTLTLFPKSTDPTLAVNGTSFRIASTGKVNFVSGQTFPGTGTITGVTTATSSGLQGGGTTGTLGLSLLKSCATGQTLAWSGSAWACKTISGGGGGTVTSVGLSAPSSDFTVAGSPITNSGTLGLNWTVAPTSANTANAIVKRDANGSFSANSITSNSITSTGTIVAGTLGVNGNAVVAGIMGIGTNFAQAELNLNAGGTASADTLLIGNNTSKGLQMRDNGNGVDLESIGVPLYVNFVTQQPAYINPNGGPVFVDIGGVPGGGGPAYALNVGAIVSNGSFDSALFGNDVLVLGNFDSTGSKNFRIDHPLDPTNKYLLHAAIESSEVLNQYSGKVVLDNKGEARVKFPAWFGAINEDFRYQLTAIGAPGPNLYVAEEIKDNSFVIAGGQPGMKVSWQVTARRNDAYMRAHPFVVERDKSERERGRYSNPELYGAPRQQGISQAHRFAGDDKTASTRR